MSSVDDLDLLLSLQDDRVPETPPSSPSPHPRRTLPNDSPTRPAAAADMSIFRDAVKDYLDAVPTSTSTNLKSKKPNSQEATLEKFSGLRIKNQLISSQELTNKLSDIRFVRLSTIKNLSDDKLSGSWATIGVLTEKGETRLTSARKNYCIWKMGCLNESSVSVFLFGDAYSRDCQGNVGDVYVLFNAKCRQEAGGKSYSGFSLNVNSGSQILKLGTAADYGRCSGKRKDGVVCGMILNRRKGVYCKYHTPNTSQKYSTMRAELKGGNIRMSRTQPEGVHMFDPMRDRTNTVKSSQRVTVLSVDGLKKALSKSDKVTTNPHSQGVRFLTHVTASMEPKVPSKGSTNLDHLKDNSLKRPTSDSKMATKSKQEVNKSRNDHPSAKMMEIDIVSSDEEADDIISKRSRVFANPIH